MSFKNTAQGFGNKFELSLLDNQERPLDSYLALVNVLAELEAKDIKGAFQVRAKMNNPLQDKAQMAVARHTGSQGTVSLASVLAGDTVTVNGLVYTAVAGAKANNTQFSIGGTDAADALDLVDSVNNDTRAGTLGDVAAIADSTDVIFFQVGVDGAAGNATTLASSNGVRLSLSGATFSGGGTTSVITVRDIDGVLEAFEPVVKSPNPTAITAGRAINLEVQRLTSFVFTARSFKACLNAIQKVENSYEAAGGDAGADTATDFAATDVTVKGATPSESFVFNIEKTGNFYVIIPTANS